MVKLDLKGSRLVKLDLKGSKLVKLDLKESSLCVAVGSAKVCSLDVCSCVHMHTSGGNCSC